MKQTEEGIVLSRKAYSESSIILHVFTRHSGQQHFIYQGFKKKKGQMLFPLAWIRFSFYRRNDSTLGKISETEQVIPLINLVSNPIKSSLAFFIAEMLENMTQINHQDERLYQFITEEIQWLNQTEEWSNYLVWFLAALTRIEGFQPEIKSDTPNYFDLQEGVFTNETPLLPAYLEDPWLHWMVDSLQRDKADFLAFSIPKEERIQLVDAWIQYYEFHVSGMKRLKTLEIIRTVFYE